MKTGFVALVGRPNTGKSTLLNQILNKKIAIVSSKAQTTRKNILGIYRDEEAEITFIDTPGIHRPAHKLGKALNRSAYYGADDADLLLFMVDAIKSVSQRDKMILERLKEKEIPTFLLINKIDKLNNKEIFDKINYYKEIYDFAEIIPVSALRNDNIDTLLKVIKLHLEEGEPVFDKEIITTETEESIISEMIREKVLILTKEEVPHAAGIIVEKITKKKDLVTINALIIVDRETLKKIIIGKNGQMIKEIGTRARKDIEEYLDNKVLLKLFVKVKPKWRDNDYNLKELGF